jgi:hypothetical protein
MQVIGLCRFSYPAIGGFQVEHDTIEARKAYLWSRERLEERFRLFEAITLPALRHQTDDDFTFLVVSGEDFPQQDRLLGLLDGMPQARVVTPSPQRMRIAMRELLNEARTTPDAPCLQFRLDDDDAVAVDFVAALRRAAQDCAGLLDRNRCVAFDWPSGLYAEAGADGLKATELLHRPYDAAALGMYARGGSEVSIMNFNHKRIAHNMPALSFAKPLMYVRTHNTFNDSRQKPVKDFEMAAPSPEIAQELETRFHITQAHVKDVFSKQPAR